MKYIGKRYGNYLINEFKGQKIIINVETGFVFICSEMMYDFLVSDQEISFSEYIKKCNGHYPEILIDAFAKKVELYKEYLFSENKMDFKIEKYDYVKTLSLYITSSCNMQCKYCFIEQDIKSENTSMTIDTAKYISECYFDYLKGRKGNIIFTGGEPLINFPIIQYIVDTARKRKLDIDFMIKTNGTLLSDEIQEFIIFNKIEVQISLDGNQEAHDKNRIFPNGEGTFKVVASKITDFINKGYGDFLKLHGTVTSETIHYVRKSVDYIRNQFSNIVFDLKPVRDKYSGLSDEEYLYFEEVLKKIDYKETKGICGIGKWHLAIDPVGNIFPCYSLIGIEKYKIGNIFLNGLNVKKIERLEQIYSRWEKEECKDCYLNRVCCNGCYADKLLQEDGCNNADAMMFRRLTTNMSEDIDNIALMPII